MDLKQLEYFVRVAGTGSFTRASARLGVDQPALSKQVRRLEIELKQPLFERHGRGVELTLGGALVLRHAQKILDEVAELHEALDASRKEVHGSVVIATAATTRPALTGFIGAFRARFPQAALEILEARSRLINEWLLEGRIDMGILLDAVPARGVETIPLIDQALYLVSRAGTAPASAPVPFKSLAKLPLILPNQMNSIRTLVEGEAARLGMKLRVVLQVEGGPLILDLVQQGHGHAILPASSVSMRNLAGKLQLNEIVQPSLARGVSLAIAAHRRTTRLARETRKLLEQHLGEGVPARPQAQRARGRVA